MTTPQELLVVAQAAANAGGRKLIEGIERGDKEVKAKDSRTSIVTWADEASQAAVFDVITDAFPEHCIMGEEGDGGNVGGDFTWIVDPLDGTTNYARGLPFWAVSVAVGETGGPVLAGVIHNPLTGENFAAARGHGVSFSVSDTADVGHSLVATGLQHDDPERIAEYASRVEQLHVRCRGVRGLGSPAMCMAYVAAGRLDAFIEKDATYAWDIAAGIVLIEEAGGTVTNLDGRPPNLGRGIANVIASNGRFHRDLIEAVA